MGTLEFVATVIRSLSWPLAVIGLTLFLRNPIADLLALVSKVKYRDLEVQFGDHLTRAEQHIPVVAYIDGGLAVRSTISDSTWDLADVYPPGAVIESWVAMERAMADTAREYDLEVDSHRARGSVHLERALARAGLVGPELQGALRELRAMRNRVAHEPDSVLDPESAQRYVWIAARAINSLRQATPNTG